MCGIAGHVRRSGRADEDVARKQVETMYHRGPDATGLFANGPAALGQTRLSVIDLITGDPPVTTAEGRTCAILNGEIYNFRDLRADLLLQNHVFTTTGDTEVIAHLAEDRSGVDLARPLRGMFGLASYNVDTGVTTLARDITGQKPLYYHLADDILVFGSEIKAVLAHPAVPRRLHLASLPSYLSLGAAGTPWTMYEGIMQLPPGHALTISPDFDVQIAPFWELRIPGAHPVEKLEVSFERASVMVREALAQAVRRRLVADVPLGAFLSGGVDSSLVVALMAREVGDNVKTFTIGFEDTEGFDERPYARRVAKRYRTDHHEFVVRPDAIALIERLVHHYDEPFGDSSAIPTYLVSELTRAHVTVALSGDGGDELFGGYERFAAGVAVAYLDRLAPKARGLLLRALEQAPGSRLPAFAGGARRGHPQAFFAWISFVRPDDVARLLGGEVPPSPGLEEYSAIFEASAGGSALDRLLYLNARTYLLDDLLPKVDRTSMAHALEVRSPFLDQELMELAFRLPPRHKVRGRSLKRVLKQAARGLVPDEVMDRPKQGFGVPLERWFRTDLKAYVEARLVARSARLHQLVDGDVVRNLVAEHQSGVNHHHTIWSLLTLEEWLRKEGW